MILVPPPPKPLRTWRLRRLAALTAPFKVHSPGFEDFFCFFFVLFQLERIVWHAFSILFYWNYFDQCQLKCNN